jgi:YgiT-type zinc finger domain-containing protein
MTPLLRIKRCCLTGRVVFSEKADAERTAGHLALDDVLEAVVNAPAIYKTLRSRSNRRAARSERLYVIVGFTHEGIFGIPKARSAGSRMKTGSTSSSPPSAPSRTDMMLSRCPSCGHTGITAGAIDKTYQIDGVSRRVRGVPALVCPHCGERFIGPEGAAYVDRKLGAARRGRRPAA